MMVFVLGGAESGTRARPEKMNVPPGTCQGLSLPMQDHTTTPGVISAAMQKGCIPSKADLSLKVFEGRRPVSLRERAIKASSPHLFHPLWFGATHPALLCLRQRDKSKPDHWVVLSPSLQETLNRAKLWLRDLEKEFLPHEIVIALVGNKTDLAAKREVATEVSTCGELPGPLITPSPASTGICPSKAENLKGFQTPPKSPYNY